MICRTFFFFQIFFAAATLVFGAPNPQAPPPSPSTSVPGATWSAPGTGSPTGTPVPKPSDCERAGVFACEHVLWGGACTLFNNCVGGAPEQCTVVPDTLKISSVGPDKGYKCIFYKTTFCRDIPGATAGALTLVWPGNDRLTEAKDQNDLTWNDNIRSYQCFKEE